MYTAFMAVLTISEARAALPEVVTRAAEGEEITITRHGAPVAVMVRPDIVWSRPGDDEDEAGEDARLIAALRARARKHGLTLEGELRMILDKAESQPPQPLPPIQLKTVRTGITKPITREDLYDDEDC
jgi:hypothetical protein